MEKTRVFKNGGSVAVRLPSKYALPPGEVMIEKRNGLLVLHPVDDKGWPEDLAERFAPLGELEIPERAEDSRSVDF